MRRRSKAEIEKFYENDVGLQIVRAELSGDLDFLREKIKTGELDPLKVDVDYSWNRLHKADMINPSNPDTVQFYIDLGVNVDAKDCYQCTPLYYSVRKENIDSVRQLLAAGADVNAENERGVTPLRKALGNNIHQRNYDLIKLLLDNGADVHHVVNRGSIIDQQKEFFNKAEHQPIIKLLEQYA